MGPTVKGREEGTLSAEQSMASVLRSEGVSRVEDVPGCDHEVSASRLGFKMLPNGDLLFCKSPGVMVTGPPQACFRFGSSG